MDIDTEIITKLNALIVEGGKLKGRLHPIPSSNYTVAQHNQKHYQESERWRQKCLIFLKFRFGINSDHYQNFEANIEETSPKAGEYYEENVGKALGVMEAALYSLEAGLTEDLFYKKEVELFDDLLRQANEFLEKDFDFASGIYGRIVLETTIREFANKNNISENKFEHLIIKLRQAKFISKPDENSFRANYEIGSWAAHGKEEFKNLSKERKKEFLDFIRDKVLTLK